MDIKLSKNVINRIIFYIDKNHNGNKSALAREWNTSYAQLAGVLNGTRKLSSSTIHSAASKGYNVQWLLTGQGHPFINVEGQKESIETKESNGFELIELYEKLIATKDDLITELRNSIKELKT